MVQEARVRRERGLFLYEAVVQGSQNGFPLFYEGAQSFCFCSGPQAERLFHAFPEANGRDWSREAVEARDEILRRVSQNHRQGQPGGRVLSMRTLPKLGSMSFSKVILYNLGYMYDMIFACEGGLWPLCPTMPSSRYC